MTEAAAALIGAGDKFMIRQRPANKARGLLRKSVGAFTAVARKFPILPVHLTLFHAAMTGASAKTGA